jgi:hypothetical protein
MKLAAALLPLLLASCVLPDSVGPYAETTVPVGWYHDYVGVGGVEAMYGPWVVGGGHDAP